MIRECDYDKGIIQLEIEDGKMKGKIVELTIKDALSIYNIVDQVKNNEEIDYSLKLFSNSFYHEIEEHYMIKKELGKIYKQKKQILIEKNQNQLIEASIGELMINRNIDEIIDSEIGYEKEEQTNFGNQKVVEALDDFEIGFETQLDLTGKTTEEILEELDLDEEYAKYIM